uniref:Uncharacterized protein n=1 Tax=Gasterosteus aculeatus TaxID=69293 RepID=G3PIP2_GASAC
MEVVGLHHFLVMADSVDQAVGEATAQSLSHINHVPLHLLTFDLLLDLTLVNGLGVNTKRDHHYDLAVGQNLKPVGSSTSVALLSCQPVEQEEALLDGKGPDGPLHPVVFLNEILQEGFGEVEVDGAGFLLHQVLHVQLGLNCKVICTVIHSRFHSILHILHPSLPLLHHLLPPHPFLQGGVAHHGDDAHHKKLLQRGAEILHRPPAPLLHGHQYFEQWVSHGPIPNDGVVEGVQVP